MEDSRLQMDMIRGLLEKVDALQNRVTALEKNAEETDTGVYYDHLDESYVDYINKELAKKRRGD